MSDINKKEISILALHLGVGGVESSVAFLSNILSKDYKVTIICTYKLNDNPAFKLNDNIKVEYLIEDLVPNKQEFIQALKKHQIKYILKEGIKSLKILFLRKYTMIKRIKQIKSGIIISTRYIFSNWLGNYGNKNIIKIAQEHNHHNNNKKYIKKVINSLKNIDYFMPVSNELTSFYKERIKNKKTKCLYIPHGLEYYPEEISNMGNKQILAIGRLEPVKGFTELIEIFKEVSLKCPEWRLNIVGEGKQYYELAKKIKDLRLENKVFLLGNKNREELNEIFLESSIYVMTSYSESFGLVLIEAESFGIPLVAYDSAQGAKEIIKDKHNGFLIHNRNREEMISKILELISNQELRSSIGKKGREDSEKYKQENISKKWKEFLNTID